MYLVDVVCTNQINTISFGTKPFSVSTIYHNSRNTYSFEQVISIIGSIVAWHLDLAECCIFFSYLVAFYHESVEVGSYPNVMIFIFCHILYRCRSHVCSILVDEAFINKQSL